VVCKNSNCQAQNIDCHVKWKASNIFILKLYGTMIFGKCKPCGCTAKNHKIIFYKSISEYTKIIDEYIEYKISINKIDQIYKQDCIDILEKQIDQLKKQQNIVGEIIPQFAQFLKQNAIAVYNDAYVEYLDHIIRLERQKASTSENYNNKILEGLDEVKRIYNERMKIIEEMIKDNDPASCSLSPEDIIKLENKLYNLPNFGNYLRTIKKEEERAFKYQERHYKFSENALNVLKKIFNNQ
ncbi:35678_t:CDS:1, partial [Racocetra persica]